MKKIVYSITLFCLMFIGLINVYAAGSIDVSETNLNILKDGAATFDIVTNNVTAMANVSVDNTSVAIIDFDSYDSNNGVLQTTGKWISNSSGKGRTINHTITVKAVGNVGDTATITVEINDASTFDNPVEEIATSANKIVKTINVTIVEAGSTPVTPTVQEYTVTYNANGGKNAPEAQVKKTGEALTLRSTKPTREGYEFTGWNTKTDGSGTSYSAGGQYTTDANLALYAQWKQTSNVTKNPQTGDTLIYLVLLLTLCALIYSYWYMKKAQEN